MTKSDGPVPAVVVLTVSEREGLDAARALVERMLVDSPDADVIGSLIRACTSLLTMRLYEKGRGINQTLDELDRLLGMGPDPGVSNGLPG